MAHLIAFNDYLDFLSGATLYNKIGITELNKISLNSMPNSWSKQAYVQGFDSEIFSFKKAVKMFKQIEIAESI